MSTFSLSLHREVQVLTIASMLALCVATLKANVVIETVPVGNPGNAGEWSGHSQGEDRICGEVDYIYSIGRCEITAAQ